MWVSVRVGWSPSCRHRQWISPFFYKHIELNRSKWIYPGCGKRCLSSCMISSARHFHGLILHCVGRSLTPQIEEYWQVIYRYTTQVSHWSRTHIESQNNNIISRETWESKSTANVIHYYLNCCCGEELLTMKSTGWLLTRMKSVEVSSRRDVNKIINWWRIHRIWRPFSRRAFKRAFTKEILFDHRFVIDWWMIEKKGTLL